MNGTGSSANNGLEPPQGPPSLSDEEVTTVATAVLRGADGEWVDEDDIGAAIEWAERTRRECELLELVLEGLLDIAVREGRLAFRMPAREL